MDDSFRIVDLYPHEKQIYQLQYSGYIQFILSLVSCQTLFSKVTEVSLFSHLQCGNVILCNRDKLLCHSLHSTLWYPNIPNILFFSLHILKSPCVIYNSVNACKPASTTQINYRFFILKLKNSSFTLEVSLCILFVVNHSSSPGQPLICFPSTYYILVKWFDSQLLLFFPPCQYKLCGSKNHVSCTSLLPSDWRRALHIISA